MRVDFLQAALSPSCCLTGKTTGYRPSGGAPFVQVQPIALTSRRGERRSFWGAGPCGLAVEVPRQKARWQTPYTCLVPLAGATGNHNDRTSRCRHEGSRNATRYNRHHRITKNRSAHGARP